MKHTVYLRPLDKSDLNENYLGWVNDLEVTWYMETGTFPITMEKLEKYYDFMTNSPNHLILAIMVGQKHIGNITLNDINWIHRTANLGIMIGDKDYWGKGYGIEAIKLMTQHAFSKLNLHKIWLSLWDDNVAALRTYEKAGYKVEAVLLDELCRNGKYHDRIYMGIINDSNDNPS